MNLKFFVTAISYHPENNIPSVFIHIKNFTGKPATNTPQLLDSHTDMKKIVSDMLQESIKDHQTTLMISLSEYHKWGVRVGDVIDVGLQISNRGEISQ